MNDKNILVLLNDYTKPSLSTSYGIHLAKALNVPATLLAIERLAYPGIPVIYPDISLTTTFPRSKELDTLRERALPHLQKIKDDLHPIWHKIDYKVAIGFPESKAVGIAEEQNPYAMVVEGGNDLSTLNEWFGTYETRIAEDADCPVLVIQPEFAWKPVKKILYIMDMDDDTKMKNMQALTTFSTKLMAHLKVVLISEDEEGNVDEKYRQMVDFFNNMFVSHHITFHRLNGMKSGDRVNELVDTDSPDWIAFEHKDKGFFQRVLGDYNTERLVLQAERPVLVF